ncbi:MAG TPA: NUDIX domain-containing protein [Cyclobacteriaceae bacterium]|nr:NUDIX domain-containing protein [Cyclobacteriaceae bacterium]
MKTDNRKLNDRTIDFLIEEYKALNEALANNEEAGERRLTFFQTLTTAVVGGVIALFTFSEKDKPEMLTDLPMLQFLVVFALLILFIIGFVIYLRILKRNDWTDAFIEDIKRIRKLIKTYVDHDEILKSLNYSAFNRPPKSVLHARYFTSLSTIVLLLNCLVLSLAVFLSSYLTDRSAARLTESAFLSITAFVFSVLVHMIFQKKKATDKPTHAGGIIVDRNKMPPAYLFVPPSRAGNKPEWVLPKGHIEDNESVDLAAVREVMEETGFYCSVTNKSEKVGPFSTENEKNIVVQYYLMEIRGKLDTTIEQRRSRWFTAKEIQESDEIPEEIKELFSKVVSS